MKLNQHVGEVEHEVKIIEETAGKLKIPAPIWVLLWGVFLTVISTTMWVGSTVATINVQMRMLTQEVSQLNKDIHTHIESPGHPVMQQRMGEVEQDLDQLRYDVIEGKRPEQRRKR